MPEENMAPTSRFGNMYRYAGAVVVIFALVLGAWYFTRSQPLASPAVSNTPEAVAKNSEQLFAALAQENADFAQSQSFLREGNYAEAEQSLERAFSGATERAKRDLIGYWLAHAYAINARYKEAVALLMRIANDTRYAPIIRAYAVQKMALMYRQYWSPVITDEVFKNPAFASMLEKDDPVSSYRRLFEYAATLYPLALSELYVADWYADDALYARLQIRDNTIAKAAGNARIAQDKAVIRQRIAAADPHLTLVLDGVIADESIYAALERRAVVVGKMQRLGDNSTGDAERAFKDLLSRYEKDGITTDGTVRFQYAIFLARKYKNSRAADVRAVLAPVYTSPGNRSPSLEKALILLKDVRNGESGTKSATAYVASLDSAFKKYLISLGWDDADFADAQ